MMMNEKTTQYTLAHADDDVRQLALKGCSDAEVDMVMALQQISGRQIARSKIPSWAALNDIHYPVHMSMEQCSSEATARYKARLVTRAMEAMDHQSPSTPFRKLVDLTGGFGVDFAFMAETFDESIYVERNESLCAIVYHNLQVLANAMKPSESLSSPKLINPSGPQAFSVVNAEAEEFLRRMEEHVALIYIDPARRDKQGMRTYSLSDCTPDVLPMMDELLSKADHVLLKLSPMLDWRKAMADVGSEHVEQIHIVAVGGECKELLLFISATGSPKPLLVCSNDDRQESFYLFEPTEASSITETTQFAKSHNLRNPRETQWSEKPRRFLFEPHAALMKGGFFNELAQRYGVSPLAPNSHLFTSDKLVDNFPGRTFHVTAVSTMNKQELKEKVMPIKQANISVRNFPMSVDALRKKLKLSEGGNTYLFATTLVDGRHIILLGNKL